MLKPAPKLRSQLTLSSRHSHPVNVGILRAGDESFRNDSVNYPEALGGYLEYLWDQASEDGAGISAEEVQAALDLLGEWLAVVERSSPSGLFRGYK